jgi:LysM repeat protein
MLVRPIGRQRGTFARSVAAASIAIAASLPQFLNAQQPAPATAAPASDSGKTHTVKRGDTLWDIAKTYLGDAFLWPEIYRLNTGTIEDPHWIFPGEQLKLPGDHAAVVKVVAVAASETPADSSSLPPVTAEIPAKPPMDSAVAAAPVEPLALLPTFVHDTATPMLQPRATAVLPGEYIAAPWVDRDGGPRNPGSLIESADIPGVSAHQKGRLQLHDRVFIAPPSGSAPPAQHALFLTYRLGPILEDFGQIVIPTGILEVSQPGNAGEASVASVVKMFGEVKQGQRLVMLDSGSANVIGHPSAITNGRTGKVRWVLDSPVLPSLQSYVVIDISGRDGLTTGDLIQILKPRQRPNDSHDLALPEIPIAQAQVLRVTPYGATAIVTAQEQPHIVEGIKARVAAKMP